ncbi:MAG: Lrp/AsnC ligand binding domain-containing protein [Acetobacteraceae bacterium]
MGLGLTVFLLIRTRQHSESWLEKFRRIMLDIPNVIDFHRLAGDYDYQVKLAVPDIKEFDRIYRDLIARIDLRTVTSCISMEDYCDDREYPI